MIEARIKYRNKITDNWQPCKIYVPCDIPEQREDILAYCRKDLKSKGINFTTIAIDRLTKEKKK